MTPATRTRRRRRSLVVLAGDGGVSDRGARALADSLAVAGIEPIYVGRERSPAQIARTAVAEAADAVELCLGAGGVLIIRELLRELDRIGRRDISLVLHRMA
jgi:methylmalonyl-CoA mutase cobalamin-binding domain/chain